MCVGLYHAYRHGIILSDYSGLWPYAPSENIYLDLYCANRHVKFPFFIYLSAAWMMASRFLCHTL